MCWYTHTPPSRLPLVGAGRACRVASQTSDLSASINAKGARHSEGVACPGTWGITNPGNWDWGVASPSIWES